MERCGNVEGVNFFRVINSNPRHSFRGDKEGAKVIQKHSKFTFRNPLRKSESIFLLNGTFKSGILMFVNRIHSAIKRHFELCLLVPHAASPSL